MKKPLETDRFRLGACYYPEHWPQELWDEDFARMAQMGFSVVRMAEFAWTIFEPSEGTFEFGFFGRVMDLAHQRRLSVILGTPTAAPPAWLTHKYPEALNATREGISFRHGLRRHCNYNAPVIRELSARIAGKMAEAFHRHPSLIGWQIDNELNCEVSEFYSEADQTAFRAWLQAKYRDLDALNEAWGAIFWNQTFTDWEQLRLTGPAPSYSPNPHQALDEKRFFSDSALSFAALQSEAIRAHDRDHFITTQGLFQHLDHHRLAEQSLDFLSYDSYPAFAFIYPDEGQVPLLDRAYGLHLSTVRDVSPNFCVMEQQSGPGGWSNRIEQSTPKPGQMRLWTFQSVAHGADALLYFRWRTAPFGTEIYWHGINDHHNLPSRRCEEAARIGSDIAKLEGLVGTRYSAEVAILRDYDNEWDGELDTWHGPYERQSVLAWFAALQYRHVPVDVKYLTPEADAKDLSAYHCLIYPHPAILSERTALILKEFVEAGGTLVFGCRTGYKDQHGHCPMRSYPGPVADLCGVSVDDFTRLISSEEPKIHFMDAGSLPAGPFIEALKPVASVVLARYGEGAGHFAGAPALAWNAWGHGSAYYFGSVFNPATAAALAARIGLETPFPNLFDLPSQVEVAVRQDVSSRFIFLLNYSSSPQPISFKRPCRDLLSEVELDGQIELEPFGVLVFREGIGSAQ